MHFLRRIKLANFRNFKLLDLSFGNEANFIIGRNGIGKTNLLEAIFLLSTGRSFRTSDLSELIKTGEKAFYIEAEFVSLGISHSLFLSFDGKKKEMRHNQNTTSNFIKLLGLLPSVIHSPSDICLIAGQPKDRRRFMNLHIAQKDPLYAHHLTRFAKALLQRNALLKQKKRTSLEVWEEEMEKSLTYLMAKRKSALEEISKNMQAWHSILQDKEEEPSLAYAPSIDEELRWTSFKEKEFVLGYTLFGPHRDDVHILLNGKLAKGFASEGQKRTLISAIKLAEYHALPNALFLIDDFGIHLDSVRKDLLKKQMGVKGQTFITSPEEIFLKNGSMIPL